MNLLDENFPDDQREILRKWRIPNRKLGVDVSQRGVQDEDIISILHRRRGITFFTLDEDFFKRGLRHHKYCLVFLDVRPDDAAHYIRRFLRHRRFRTVAKRTGIVVRVHPGGVQVLLGKIADLGKIGWEQG